MIVIMEYYFSFIYPLLCVNNALKVNNLFLEEIATLPQHGEPKFEFQFNNVGYALNMIISCGEPMENNSDKCFFDLSLRSNLIKLSFTLISLHSLAYFPLNWSININ